jgi:hypothetical protein
MYPCRGVKVNEALRELGLVGSNKHTVDYEEICKNGEGVHTICKSCMCVVNAKKGLPRAKTPLQQCETLYSSMKGSSTKRGHDPPEFKCAKELLAHFRQIAGGDEDNSESSTLNIKIGEAHSFKVELTNGLFDTISPERKDENIGYTKENTTLLPVFLNAGCGAQFSGATLDVVADLACEPWEEQEVRMILASIKNPNGTHDTKSCMRRYIQMIVDHCRSSTKKRKRKRQAMPDSTLKIADIVEMIVAAGGRCALTGTKLVFLSSTPHTNEKWRQCSVDRVEDVAGGYTRDNVRLVCSGMNYANTGGQTASKQLNLSTRIKAGRLSNVTKEYMRSSMWGQLPTDEQLGLWAEADRVAEKDRLLWGQLLNEYMSN